VLASKVHRGAQLYVVRGRSSLSLQGRSCFFFNSREQAAPVLAHQSDGDGAHPRGVPRGRADTRSRRCRPRTPRSLDEAQVAASHAPPQDDRDELVKAARMKVARDDTPHNSDAPLPIE